MWCLTRVWRCWIECCCTYASSTRLTTTAPWNIHTRTPCLTAVASSTLVDLSLAEKSFSMIVCCSQLIIKKLICNYLLARCHCHFSCKFKYLYHCINSFWHTAINSRSLTSISKTLHRDLSSACFFMAENMTKSFAFSLFYRVDNTAILHNSHQSFRIPNFCCPSLHGRLNEYQLVWVGWGVFTCVGWQVTLCDLLWQVTRHSCEMEIH